MADFTIVRLEQLPPDRLAELVAESEAAGFRFVRSLVEEWESGQLRFDRPGEALFAAQTEGRVVGVGGLTIDPYGGRPDVGRVRRVYVLAAWRRQGAGRQLVQAAVATARGHFRVLRLRAENVGAGRLYERLGFRPCDEPDCTHALELV
jgi:GNAT superfamily N-acetyltransferase